MGITNQQPGTMGPYYSAGAPTTAVNEVQTISSTGTGGTKRIGFQGAFTGNIAHSASAATIQSALRALSTINGANVNCAGGALPNTPVTVTFVGELAGENVDMLQIDNTNLTGGTATVAQTTAGVAASAKGALVGATLIDETNGIEYINTGTNISPIWSKKDPLTKQAAIAALGTTTALVGVDGTGSNAAPLAGTETRLDAIETKIDAVIAALVAAGVLSS